MAAIGDRIKQRRTEKGLSLAELARRATISKGYLHTLENGDTPNPSADVLFKIANELDTTIADLLGEEEPGATTSSADEAVPSSLRDFARTAKLPEVDVQMLAHIRYRGKRPQTEDDWRYIYESIKRTLK